MWFTLLVPRRTSGGCIAFAALLGVVLGVCGACDTGFSIALFVAFFIAPATLLGSILALRCRKPFVALLCGFAMFAASTLSEMTARWTHLDPGWQSFMTLGDVVRTFGVIGLEAVFASLLSLAGFGLTRLIVRVKAGDGSACWRCLYVHDNPGASVCPECGRALDESQCRLRVLHSAFDRLNRRRTWLNLAAGVILMVTAGLFVKVNRQNPLDATPFISRFEGLGKLQAGFVYAAPTATPTAALGATIDPGKNALVVCVAYLPKDVPGLPAMQLQLHKRLGGTFFEMFEMSSPRVLCNLDRAAADWILAHGLPQGMIDAFVARASFDHTDGPDVLIDPREFLPSDAWTTVQKEPPPPASK
jgi:hypothetical protein